MGTEMKKDSAIPNKFKKSNPVPLLCFTKSLSQLGANTGLKSDPDSAIPNPNSALLTSGKPLSTSDRKRRHSGRTTLSDVARAAEVSPITVSRALRGERNVAPELVERVKQAAQQLGYVPIRRALLASQRSAQVPVTSTTG